MNVYLISVMLRFKYKGEQQYHTSFYSATGTWKSAKFTKKDIGDIQDVLMPTLWTKSIGKTVDDFDDIQSTLIAISNLNTEEKDFEDADHE